MTITEKRNTKISPCLPDHINNDVERGGTLESDGSFLALGSSSLEAKFLDDWEAV